jgi:hypothetical protein
MPVDRSSGHRAGVGCTAGAIVLLAAGALAHPDAPPRAAIEVSATRYRGLCDASAAVALSPTRFVVANDEDNLLRVFRFGNPVATAKPLDLSAFLGIANGKEVDIEGAARMGDLVYWITSHGRNKDGERQSRRLRLFATRVTPGGELRQHGVPYRDLLTTFIEPVLQAHGVTAAPDGPADPAKAPEKPDGLNVEGLAASGSSLLLGFRNPQPKVDGSARALVVELKNPEQLITASPKAPLRGEVFRLDLGGRGIRSLEALPGGRGFLIVAGPFDGTGAFALYRWNGTHAQSPAPVPGLDFGDFAPEALFVDMPSSPGQGPLTLTTISDDGDARLEDGTTCKEAPKKRRRTRLAKIGLD